MHAQIQVELKLRRLQYIAYEPVFATLAITNQAGRDIELRDDRGQHWFGFEVTGKEGQPIAPTVAEAEEEPPLRIESGKTVVRKVNLTPLYGVHDPSTYHVRANVFFADLNKFFYSPARAFQVINARPIWQTTVGVPEGSADAGSPRTYSLLSNRFADHTSLYVRVENKDTGLVYATYSLGRVVAYDEPQKKSIAPISFTFCIARPRAPGPIRTSVSMDSCSSNRHSWRQKRGRTCGAPRVARLPSVAVRSMSRRRRLRAVPHRNFPLARRMKRRRGRSDCAHDRATRCNFPPPSVWSSPRRSVREREADLRRKLLTRPPSSSMPGMAALIAAAFPGSACRRKIWRSMWRCGSS